MISYKLSQKKLTFEIELLRRKLLISNSLLTKINFTKSRSSKFKFANTQLNTQNLKITWCLILHMQANGWVHVSRRKTNQIVYFLTYHNTKHTKIS